MDLELAITSYQRLSPTVISSKTFSDSVRYILGRAKDCDWCLPDPDRVVSSRHAEIYFKAGQFWVKDISTNGVFVNGSPDPLGSGGEVALSAGDTLRFGDYELSARLPEAVQADPPAAIPENQSVAVLPFAGHGGSVGDQPVPEHVGANPTLAAGLGEQRLGDSHVEIPEPAIPPVWSWGEPPEDRKGRAPEQRHTDPALEALFAGLGMPQLAKGPVDPALLEGLGHLSRIMLERLLDLLHARSRQKQKLRVQQTLFQRSENNPLKFSATAQDAIEALLLRRHSSFLGPQEAVEEAFSDILRHERALMAGVERVVAELLQRDMAPTGAAGLNKLSVVRKARAYDALGRKRALQRYEYGDTDRMLRSDAFVEAYETAVRTSD